jgi:hypothetical protein
MRPVHLCLPVACLVYPGLAVHSRQARGAVLENLDAGHARTARAKGLPESRVITGHILRKTASSRSYTMFVQVFPAILAGSVIVERIFSLPGMGSLMLTAIAERDREVILAIPSSWRSSTWARYCSPTCFTRWPTRASGSKVPRHERFLVPSLGPELPAVPARCSV